MPNFHRYIRSADVPAGKDSDRPSYPAGQNGPGILRRTGRGLFHPAVHAAHRRQDPVPVLFKTFPPISRFRLFPPELRQSSTRKFFLRCIQTKVFLHPLTAPYARVEIRLHTKWLSGKLLQCASEGISRCKNRCISFSVSRRYVNFSYRSFL